MNKNYNNNIFIIAVLGLGGGAKAAGQFPIYGGAGAQPPTTQTLAAGQLLPLHLSVSPDCA
jgi:hypothetical protein